MKAVTGALVLLACIVTIPVLAALPTDAAFITMEDPAISMQAVHTVIATCSEVGGHAYHVMPVHLPGPARELSGCCLIASVPPGQEPAILGLEFVTGLYRPGQPIVKLPSGDEAVFAAGAWEHLIDDITPPPPPGAEPLPNDLLIVPGSEEESSSKEKAGLGLAAFAAPGPSQTSEFMVGNIALGVVLPESTGSSENWSNGDPLYPGMNRQQLVYNKVVSGANWWATSNTAAKITYFYDQRFSVSTTYEPITQPTANNGETAWVGSVLTTMGYSGLTAFAQAYAYDNWMRSNYGTDWAFAVFVADSLNDTDGMFAAPGMGSAFAYLYGPYQVMTYDNGTTGGQWTLANMNQVFAHETGHIFGAPDEYAGAWSCTCTTYGYLGVTNGNCVNCTGSPATCVMASNALQLCSFTPGHVGWRDSDGDTILDPVDGGLTFTSAYLDYGATPPYSSNPQITGHGTAQANAWPSPTRPQSVCINRIQAVMYNVGGGPMVVATPRDGAYNSDVESFDFTTAAQATGPYIVLITAADNWTNSASSPQYIFIDTTPPPMAPPMAMIVEAPYSSNPTIATVNWAPCPGDPESGIVGHQVDLWQITPPLPLPIASQYVPVPNPMWPFLGIVMMHGGVYQATVAGVNGAGLQSPAAASLTLTIDLTPPGPPTSIQDSGAGTDQFDRLSFNWTAATEDISPISDYYLDIQDGVGISIWSGWTGGPVTNYTAMGLGLTPGTKYVGMVRARNAAQLQGVFSPLSDGIMAVQFFPTIGQVKTTASPGMPVGVRSVYTTSSGAYQPGVVYAQQLDRSCGIRTDCTDSIAIGNRIEIAGILQSNAVGELELWNSEAATTGGSATIGPLAMPNRSLGGVTLGLQPGVINGTGLNNIGLLVQTWGSVTYVSAGAPYYFVVDDGSGAMDQSGLNGVGVRCGTLTPPTPGAFVKVRGVCSFENGYPVVLLRQTGDWW